MIPRRIHRSLGPLVGVLALLALGLAHSVAHAASAATTVANRDGATTAANAAPWTERTARALAPVALPDLPDTLQRATEILPLLGAAVHADISAPDSTAWAAHPLLGNSLSAYAKNTGRDPHQFETTEAAARRILAATKPTGQPAEVTARWFDDTATALLAVARAAEAIPGASRSPGFDHSLQEIKILAHLSRFHARRLLAAIHYNLFLRGQRLAELYAATLDSRTCLELWRDLVTAAGDRPEFTFPHGTATVTLHPAWREELARLTFDVTDLEAQCCPPDEAMLQEKVWTPPGK